MKNRLKKKTALETSVIAIATAAAIQVGGMSAAHAQTYTEVGDAGDTLATAQAVTGGSTVTSIKGSIGTGTDADLYAFTISSPTTFSATTNNTFTNTAFTAAQLPLDTSLFLFNSAGVEIATNDDSTGTVVTSTLAAGNPLYASLPAGTFYLGISISGNEPVNSAGQLLFALSDDTTDVRGAEAANNLNPLTLTTFDLDNYDSETGNYEVDLTGVMAVPEPAAWAWLAAGAVAGGVALARRRRLNRG